MNLTAEILSIIGLFFTISLVLFDLGFPYAAWIGIAFAIAVSIDYLVAARKDKKVKND